MTTSTDPRSVRPTASQAGTLARARRGDRRAFSRLMEPFRRELVAYCYRLTGSLAESEDLTQEAFVRAFRALDTFEGRATPRAWLYRIAHNLCLNHVQRRPAAWESLEALDEARLASAGVTAENTSQEREDLRLGFVALVQSLPPRQRAALVLRDVLGWSADEAARILETTVPAVKNALARARQTLARHPHGGNPDEVRDLAGGDPAAQALIAQWVDAFEKGNTARMVALLTSGDFAHPAGRGADEESFPGASGTGKGRHDMPGNRAPERHPTAKQGQTGYNKSRETPNANQQCRETIPKEPPRRHGVERTEREERTDAERQRA